MKNVCKQTHTTINIRKVNCFLNLIFHPIIQSGKQNNGCLVLHFTEKLKTLTDVEFLCSKTSRVTFTLSLRIKLLLLSVYVLPKFPRMAHHTTGNLDTVSNCQDSLTAELEKNKQTRYKERSFI